MKHDLNEVYKDFEKENITVLPFRFQHLKSVSLGDEKVVGIDRSKIDGCAEEYTILIHEKGHFDSGAFYTASSPYLLKEQAERRADRAAILRYIPLEELRECVSGTESAEEAAIRKEILASLNRFLGTLKETERSVFLCRYWYLDSTEEIAEKSGFTVSEVKSMLFRIRKRLYAQLTEEGLV